MMTPACAPAIAAAIRVYWGKKLEYMAEEESRAAERKNPMVCGTGTLLCFQSRFNGAASEMHELRMLSQATLVRSDLDALECIELRIEARLSQRPMILLRRTGSLEPHIVYDGSRLVVRASQLSTGTI